MVQRNNNNSVFSGPDSCYVSDINKLGPEAGPQRMSQDVLIHSPGLLGSDFISSDSTENLH